MSKSKDFKFEVGKKYKLCATEAFYEERCLISDLLGGKVVEIRELYSELELYNCLLTSGYYIHTKMLLPVEVK